MPACFNRLNLVIDSRQSDERWVHSLKKISTSIIFLVTESFSFNMQGDGRVTKNIKTSNRKIIKLATASFNMLNNSMFVSGHLCPRHLCRGKNIPKYKKCPRHLVPRQNCPIIVRAIATLVNDRVNLISSQ